MVIPGMEPTGHYWFSMYFPEYKDVYGNPDAISGMMILKKAPLLVEQLGKMLGSHS